MLNKLLKYNLKTIFRPLSVFYLIVVTCALLTRVFVRPENFNLIYFLHDFFQGATFGFLIGAIINASMNIWANFKNDFYGDPSYLMHTLPVKRSTLYWSRILTILVTYAVTLVPGLVALLIAYGNTEIFQFIRDFISTNGLIASTFQYALPLVLIIFLEIIFIVQCGITGIILGHRLNNNKVIFSVIFGFTFYIAFNCLSMGLLLLWSISDYHMNWIFASAGNFEPRAFCQIFWAGSAIYIIYLGILDYISLHSLNQGIDVE